VRRTSHRGSGRNPAGLAKGDVEKDEHHGDRDDADQNDAVDFEGSAFEEEGRESEELAHPRGMETLVLGSEWEELAHSVI
jgi:hypothetical protein